MRNILLGMCLVAGTAQAEKLNVVAFTTPSLTVVSARCALDAPSHLDLNSSTEDLFATNIYPGSVSLRITGGVAPYQIIWHEHPWVSMTHMSTMPGIVRVTVVDAEGTRVTTRAMVTSSSSYVPAPCRLWRREVIDAPPQPPSGLIIAEKAPSIKRTSAPVSERGPFTEREVTDRRDPAGRDRNLGDRWERGDHRPEPNGPRDPDRGVVNDRTTDRIGHSGAGGTHVERTARTIGR
jgi:hypothetical protein